jgi:23S rRNA pseudouridine2605 synthase
MNKVLKEGVELDDGPVKFEKLADEGGEGFNHWYRVMLKEGRNRVVRRTFDALGLPVSRLMRVRFGIINLPPRLKRGMTAELGEGEVVQVLEWVGMEKESSESRQAPQAPRQSAETAATAKGGRAAHGRGVGRGGGRKSKTGVKRG